MTHQELRDYFAAHAPAIPQDWFEPKMATKRPEPFVDGDGMARPELFTSSAAAVPNRKNPAVCQWDADYERQRCVQWPYAWADAMLAARGNQ